MLELQPVALIRVKWNAVSSKKIDRKLAINIRASINNLNYTTRIHYGGSLPK